MADITYIPIRQLHPHPDNPRKELGDLSELSASIKENGVYQNLTVIPGHYLSSREYISKCVDEGGDAAAAAAAWTPKVMWVGDDYTIIIGHRRAAAAQQAGLYELPCAIVEMDEREQMQTMMVENMQRSDLTVYEQAQGFQMMMDFGQTVEQISDKSGFSQSTVRRRIKLLELNHDNFKKAEKRGATLSDFALLDKIEDLEARNRVLETLGTQNFNRAMQDALEQQKWQHQKAEWVEQLKKFATEDSQATYQTHEHVNAYGKWGTKKEDTELEDALKMFNAYDTEPEKILLAVAFDATDSSREGYWSTEWNGPTGASKFVHRKNDDLDSTYELLAALGYEMADDEKALQDGTHQLFAVYGSGSQADTPCDKCKAAHPECDKCCKTCDDHCNAFQLCRKEYGE